MPAIYSMEGYRALRDLAPDMALVPSAVTQASGEGGEAGAEDAAFGADLSEALFLPRVVHGKDPIAERDLRPIAAELDWEEQRRM